MPRRRIAILIVLATLLVPACQLSMPAQSAAIPTSTPVLILNAGQTSTPFQPDPAWTATSTMTPTPTETPTATLKPTSTPTPTNTPTPLPTATWQTVSAGEYDVPILLYHHISDPEYANRYYVTPDTFRAQMKALSDAGYTTITVAYLAKVLLSGGELPERPIVITFDDGNIDVYQNAFPIMSDLGMVGVFYIVTNRIGAKDYVGTPEMGEMIAAGWEMGSHSADHLDLVANPGTVRYEVLQSRLDLEAAIGVPVESFAYPFGTADSSLMDSVSRYGYSAAVGLGVWVRQGPYTLYYLSRREVHYEFNMDQFLALLVNPP